MTPLAHRTNAHAEKIHRFNTRRGEPKPATWREFSAGLERELQEALTHGVKWMDRCIEAENALAEHLLRPLAANHTDRLKKELAEAHNLLRWAVPRLRAICLDFDAHWTGDRAEEMINAHPEIFGPEPDEPITRQDLRDSVCEQAAEDRRERMEEAKRDGDPAEDVFP